MLHATHTTPPEPTYVAQLRKFTSDLHALAELQSRVIGDVLREWPDDAQFTSGYLVSTPDDGEIVYAGMSKDQVVANRFYDHIHNRNPSNLSGILPRFPTYPQAADTYRVRWVPVEDLRERRFFESFVIGVIRPPFNR
jgi:hypothetical protein